MTSSRGAAGAQQHVISLTGLTRSSQALAAGGQPVAVSDLQPGDIVTFHADVSHAGIYIGDGMMVHASTYGTPVRVAPISSAPIHNARRY